MRRCRSSARPAFARCCAQWQLGASCCLADGQAGSCHPAAACSGALRPAQLPLGHTPSSSWACRSVRAWVCRPATLTPSSILWTMASGRHAHGLSCACVRCSVCLVRLPHSGCEACTGTSMAGARRMGLPSSAAPVARQAAAAAAYWPAAHLPKLSCVQEPEDPPELQAAREKLAQLQPPSARALGAAAPGALQMPKVRPEPCTVLHQPQSVFS